MSVATIIPWVVGFLGLALGGFISDYLFKLTGKQMFSRKADALDGDARGFGIE